MPWLPSLIHVHIIGIGRSGPQFIIKRELFQTHRLSFRSTGILPQRSHPPSVIWLTDSKNCSLDIINRDSARRFPRPQTPYCIAPQYLAGPTKASTSLAAAKCLSNRIEYFGSRKAAGIMRQAPGKLGSRKRSI